MQPAKKHAKWLLGRTVAPTIAAFIVTFSLTYSGSDWYEQLRRWAQPAPHAVASRESVKLGPVGAPITVTPMRPAGNDSSVSKVPLRLILVRTQPGRNSGEGFAQIGVNARTPQTYRAGAILANGARLTEIYADHVMLQRDRRSARLELRRDASSNAEAADDLLTVGGAAQPPQAGVSKQDHLTDFLRPSPVFVDDQLRGFALYAGRDQGPFFKWGLEPGDVVTQINGAAVSSPGESLAALHTLVDGAALTIEIERKGTPHTLSLDGAILAQAIAAGPSPTSHSAGLTHTLDVSSSIALTTH